MAATTIAGKYTTSSKIDTAPCLSKPIAKIELILLIEEDEVKVDDALRMRWKALWRTQPSFIPDFELDVWS